MNSKRSTLGLVFLTIFVSMVGFGIVIPVLPVYAKSEPFMMGPTSLGWLTGIFSLVQLFSAPLMGRISDRVGRKPVLLISIVGTAVGYFVTGAAGAVWMLFLGRIIDGASGGNIATAQSCIADCTEPKDRSKAMGLIGAAFGLGFILGPAIGGLLSGISHAAPFYFAGGLALVNALLVHLYLPETLTAERRAHPTEKVRVREVFESGRGAFIGILLCTNWIFTTGFASIHILYALFCADRFGWNLRQSSYAFAYVGVIAVIVQGGLIRRLLKYPIEKEITVVGCAMLAVSLWLLPGANSVVAFLAFSGLMAVGNGLATPTISGMASRHVHGHAQGRVLGLMASAGSLGRWLGPLIASLPLPDKFSEAVRPLSGVMLTTINHGYSVAFKAAAVMVAIAAILAAMLRVPKVETAPEEAAAVAL